MITQLVTQVTKLRYSAGEKYDFCHQHPKSLMVQDRF